MQWAGSRGLSQRRACELCCLARSTCRYQRRARQDDEEVLVERLQKFARRRRRRGYRLAHQELRRDGFGVFIALALRGLCHRQGINPAYIEPGKPWQNGFAESFHARLRDEFLDGAVFLTVREAQLKLDRWRRYWNEERLHSSLGYVPPDEFAAKWVESLEQELEIDVRSLEPTGS